MSVALKVLLGVLAATALVGCANQIYNVKDAPVETAGGQPITLAEVEKAIERAGTLSGWRMTLVKPGLMMGRFNYRSYTAIVDVTYDTRSFSITYNNSANLNYDGTNIHRTYNGWVRNLEKSIHVQLLFP